MKNFNSKNELRNEIKNNDRFKVIFECGLKFYHCKRADLNGGDLYAREHEYNFMWKTYDLEKFVSAVWGKLQRGGEVRVLETKNF